MTGATAWREAVDVAIASVEAAQRRASDHPLSRRKALLVAVMLDNLCDDLFALTRSGAPSRLAAAEDVLAFRHALRKASPALGLVFDLCSGGPEAAALVIRAIAVPIDDYPSLPVDDFMVSLYNGNTIQRVMITSADGGSRP